VLSFPDALSFGPELADVENGLRNEEEKSKEEEISFEAQLLGDMQELTKPMLNALLV
jgi:hypothetical protein